MFIATFIILDNMKILFLFISFFYFSNLFSQDSLSVRQVDSLVSIIQYSNFPTQRDSIFQDYSEIGLKINTHITLVTYGKELKKYAQIVKATQLENKIEKHNLMGSAFYYNKNLLIKVEEFMIEEGKEYKAEWYFYNDKCFFKTATSPKFENRISLLVKLSNTFLKKVNNPN